MTKLLVIEDDACMCELIADMFREDGFVVEVIEDGREGLDLLKHYDYDVAVVDWGLPGISGPELCRRVREAGKKLPILMLTARRETDEKEIGFDAGADDYLTKPFEPRELKARIRALLRRIPEYKPSDLNYGNIRLRPGSFDVQIGSDAVTLRPREYQLLEFFLRNPDQFFSAEALLNRVWPSDSDASPLALRACIKRVRDKISTTDSGCKITTIYSLGYKLERLPGD